MPAARSPSQMPSSRFCPSTPVSGNRAGSRAWTETGGVVTEAQGPGVELHVFSVFDNIAARTAGQIIAPRHRAEEIKFLQLRQIAANRDVNVGRRRHIVAGGKRDLVTRLRKGRRRRPSDLDVGAEGLVETVLDDLRALRPIPGFRRAENRDLAFLV